MVCFEKSNKKILSGSLAIIVGSLILIAIIFIIFCLSDQEDNYTARAEAYNITVSKYLYSKKKGKKIYMYNPTYHFRVSNGNNTTTEYSCKSTTSTVAYPVITEKTVYYNPQNPKECMTEFDISTPFWLYILLSIAIILILGGICTIYRELCKSRSLESGSVNYTSPVPNNNDFNPDFPAYNNNCNTPAYNYPNTNNMDNSTGYNSYSING